MMNHKRKIYDFLIIGSGVAGLSAALKLCESGSVCLVTKNTIEDSSSGRAQGGIAAVTDTLNDNFESHIADTITAGAGLCKLETVEEIVKSAPAIVKDFINNGVNFTKKEELEDCLEEEKGNFSLGMEGGHSQRRVLHAGDTTGKEIQDALIHSCKQQKSITILENFHAVDLITTKRLRWGDKEDTCFGAYILDVKKDVVCTFFSPVTILATGGAGKVYKFTTNPDVATGDGIAMAYRAHCSISNMEFYQFHPTCLYHPKKKSFLISEAVRGEGAKLKVWKNGKYETFMEHYHELSNLAPRDIVARAIDRELKSTGQNCVYLDITHQKKEFLQKRFPGIYETCFELGIDISQDLIPVVPAAHYCCGGIKTDTNGSTEIDRLYAVGEVACTGLHGANRLASNSLLEGAVIAHNAAAKAKQDFKNLEKNRFKVQCDSIPDWSKGKATNSDELVIITHNWAEIREFMWDYVGIFRTTKRLQRAKRRIRNIQHEIIQYYWDFVITPELIELRNLASIAEMIIDSALARKESRGLHYNVDFPELLEETQDSVLQKP